MPLDPTDDDSVDRVMYIADHVLQYGEDEEVRIPDDEQDPELTGPAFDGQDYGGDGGYGDGGDYGDE